MFDSQKKSLEKANPEATTYIRDGQIVPVIMEREVDRDSVDSSDRETWSSRMSFVIACLGSVIGLGNLWRFPFLVCQYGGGTFFIPYLSSMFLVGVPLMQLEMAIGQAFRSGVTQAYGALHPRFRGVGLANALAAFGIITYYTAILGWVITYVVESLYPDIPFSVYGLEGNDTVNIPTMHFRDDILLLSDDPNKSMLISSSVFAGLLFTWAVIMGLLWKGTKFLGKALMITVLFPVLMIFVLLFIVVSQEGAREGVRHYLGIWDFSQLSGSEIWIDAYAQVFFSLSLSTGAISTYASLNPKNSNCVLDGFLVPVLNFAFSFVTGFAVFSVMGFFEITRGMEWKTMESLLNGPDLVFVIYPAALTSLGDHAGINIATALFFLSIYMLGIDTILSLTQAVVFSIRETPLLNEHSIIKVTGYVCVVGGLVSIFYASDIGFYAFQLIDFYIGTTALIANGFFQSALATWAYRRSDVVAEVGNVPVILHEIAWFGGIIFSIILAICLSQVGINQGVYIGITIVFGVCFIVGLDLVAINLARRASRYGPYFLWFYQAEKLRGRLNEVVTRGRPMNWRLRRVWGVMMKYWIPEVLLLLFILRIVDLARNGFSGIPELYSAGYQAVGALALSGVFFCIGFGFCFPHLLEIPESPVVEEDLIHVY